MNPFAYFWPSMRQRFQEELPRMSDAVRDPEFWGQDVPRRMYDVAVGLPAASAGAPFDLSHIAWQSLAPSLGMQAAEMKDVPLTSDWWASRAGADINSPGYLLSGFMSPDPVDLMKVGAPMSAVMMGALRNADEVGELGRPLAMNMGVPFRSDFVDTLSASVGNLPKEMTGRQAKEYIEGLMRSGKVKAKDVELSGILPALEQNLDAPFTRDGLIDAVRRGYPDFNDVRYGSAAGVDPRSPSSWRITLQSDPDIFSTVADEATDAMKSIVHNKDLANDWSAVWSELSVDPLKIDFDNDYDSVYQLSSDLLRRASQGDISAQRIMSAAMLEDHHMLLDQRVAYHANGNRLDNRPQWADYTQDNRDALDAAYEHAHYDGYLWTESNWDDFLGDVDIGGMTDEEVLAAVRQYGEEIAPEKMQHINAILEQPNLVPAVRRYVRATAENVAPNMDEWGEASGALGDIAYSAYTGAAPISMLSEVPNSYRELLITDPNSPGPRYRSPHWSQDPDVLVHGRATIREVDPKAVEKYPELPGTVYQIEEIQSDWAQNYRALQKEAAEYPPVAAQEYTLFDLDRLATLDRAYDRAMDRYQDLLMRYGGEGLKSTETVAELRDQYPSIAKQYQKLMDLKDEQVAILQSNLPEGYKAGAVMREYGSSVRPQFHITSGSARQNQKRGNSENALRLANIWNSDLTPVRGSDPSVPTESWLAPNPNHYRVVNPDAEPPPRMERSSEWAPLMAKRLIGDAVKSGQDFVVWPGGAAIAAVVGGDVAGQQYFYNELLRRELQKYLKRYGIKIKKYSLGGRDDHFGFPINEKLKRAVEEGQPIVRLNGPVAEETERFA